MLWFSAPPHKMSGLSKPGLYQTGAMLYAIDVMNADKPPSNHRLTVKEAAKRLNVSEAAIRQRIQRGSIAHEKDEETNRVYVLISEDFDRLDEDETPYETSYERELIDTLREQLAAEREANRENRRIIAALASRIPEIEAPSEPREAPVTASEEPFNTHHAPQESQEPSQSRSWLHRFFFGPG
jgi:excisionase family DNA binding protein